jgi:PAS domain-containing protein
MIEMEMLTIPTVYAGTRQSGGQTNIIVKRIDGVGSKDIIGRLRQPKNPPEHTYIVTQRTIDDFRRIYATLNKNRANVGDFQFIVRQADGAVFVNDPVSGASGRGPSGNIQNIIERFESILRRKQQTQEEGVDK